MIGTMAGPLIMSYENKIRFRDKWKKFFWSVIMPALLFIVWDIVFTAKGIWSFNPEYHLGLKILLLPIEEWLFFLAVPFACIFIIETIGFFLKDIKINSWPISVALCVILLSIAILNYERLYTVTTFSLLTISIAYYEFIKKSTWLAKFYVGWLVCLIPFFIVNGILTYLPVVMYNNVENLNFRLFSIPLEDLFYGMLLILLVSGYYFDDNTGEISNELYVSNGMPESS